MALERQKKTIPFRDSSTRTDKTSTEVGSFQVQTNANLNRNGQISKRNGLDEVARVSNGKALVNRDDINIGFIEGQYFLGYREDGNTVDRLGFAGNTRVAAREFNNDSLATIGRNTLGTISFTYQNTTWIVRPVPKNEPSDSGVDIAITIFRQDGEIILTEAISSGINASASSMSGCDFVVQEGTIVLVYADPTTGGKYFAAYQNLQSGVLEIQEIYDQPATNPIGVREM